MSCSSGGFEPAGVHFRGFLVDMASPSKKSLQAAERQRSDVARARRRWIREQGMLDPARLVFIDETAVSTNMARIRGRAPRGVRCDFGHVPLGEWKTITFVAGLRHNRMTAPMVVDGPMTGEMFLAYVKQCLVPTLRRNDIVVMDNFRAHKVPGIREAIEKARATVRYLPKYSPDQSPTTVQKKEPRGTQGSSARAQACGDRTRRAEQLLSRSRRNRRRRATRTDSSDQL